MFEAGVFLIDKPAGISSFAVVSRLRRVLQIKKVGHAGTLDPFATGLLVLCAGRPATRLISGLMEGDKEYLATLLLGVETETLDTEGAVTSRHQVGTIAAATIEACLSHFRGSQLQTPPVYSALKHQGKPLYYYARKGIPITKEARAVEIKFLERTDGGTDVTGDVANLAIRVVCSKGTYIRSLAADIGSHLGCGAHLVQLRRIRSGCFSLDGCLSWEELGGDDGLDRCMSAMISIEQACKLLQ
ncbi:MAG: tRNA pseudouridine(55) synthase TruB [Proteobacteria bacterium]|nr:tRNA pseudouridine(55) synthase TruB [Pseudomonadota bacterium]